MLGVAYCRLVVGVKVHLTSGVVPRSSYANTHVQQCLPEAATVIPIICVSDGTHLTNFAGDKKAWPVYLTIANIPSKIRNKPTNMAIILIALLPIPPKFVGPLLQTDLVEKAAKQCFRCAGCLI